MIVAYQTICWLTVSALGALLVCLLTVAGEQVIAPGEETHRLREASPVTVLASTAIFIQTCFPRYYSVGFGSIRALWLILFLAYVLQALAGKFGRMRRLSGLFAPLALGMVIAPTVFGVNHDGSLGLYMLTSLPSWTLAASLLLLALFMGALQRRRRLAASIFGVLFTVTFVILLGLMIGTYTVKQSGVEMLVQPFGLLENLTEYWYCGFSLSIGIILMLASLMGNIVIKDFRAGYPMLMVGAYLSYGAIIFAAGLGDAAILPIIDNPQESVTTMNGSAVVSSLRNTLIITYSIIIALVFLNFRKFAQNFTRR